MKVGGKQQKAKKEMKNEGIVWWSRLNPSLSRRPPHMFIHKLLPHKLTRWVVTMNYDGTVCVRSFCLSSASTPNCCFVFSRVGGATSYDVFPVPSFSLSFFKFIFSCFFCFSFSSPYLSPPPSVSDNRLQRSGVSTITNLLTYSKIRNFTKLRGANLPLSPLALQALKNKSSVRL